MLKTNGLLFQVDIFVNYASEGGNDVTVSGERLQISRTFSDDKVGKKSYKFLINLSIALLRILKKQAFCERRPLLSALQLYLASPFRVIRSKAVLFCSSKSSQQ